MDWIQGDKFKAVADFTFSPAKRSGDDYDQLPNTFNARGLKDKNIIYTHTMYVKQLFDVIDKYPYNQFIVVSHNSDVNVTFPPPDNVIKWFTQNVNIIHDRIFSIPIGLENDRWFAQIRKKEKMEARMGRSKEYKNLVYMNHNIATNPAKREEPYRFFINAPFVTTRMAYNGIDFDLYLNDICSHKFVICPEGNGMDTHRTWEALYMGAIPIEKRNLNNRFYTDLPICFVDNWHDVTEDFLNHQWNVIEADKQYGNYLPLLTFEYWKEKIRNA